MSNTHSTRRSASPFADGQTLGGVRREARTRQVANRASIRRSAAPNPSAQEDSGNVLKGLAIASGIAVAFWIALGVGVWALI